MKILNMNWISLKNKEYCSELLTKHTFNSEGKLLKSEELTVTMFDDQYFNDLIFLKEK